MRHLRPWIYGTLYCGLSLSTTCLALGFGQQAFAAIGADTKAIAIGSELMGTGAIDTSATGTPAAGVSGLGISVVGAAVNGSVIGSVTGSVIGSVTGAAERYVAESGEAMVGTVEFTASPAHVVTGDQAIAASAFQGPQAPSVDLAAGPAVGSPVGPAVGSPVSPAVGSSVGPAVGSPVGPAVGSSVGLATDPEQDPEQGPARGPAIGQSGDQSELGALAQAERAHCLTFIAAIQSARNGSPEVSIANARYDIAEGALIQEKGSGRPNISAYARAAEGDSGLVDGRTNTQTGLMLSQRIFDFGQGHQRRKSAEARLRAAEFSADDAQLKLGARAGHAYISVLANRDLLSAAQRRVDRYDRLGAGVDRRLETGLITAATANSIKAEAASARAEKVDREIALESELIEVAVLTNSRKSPCQSPEKISAALSPVDPQGFDEHHAAQASAELNAARSQVQAASAEYGAAQRIRRPEVTLQVVGAYQHDSLANEWKTARRVGVDVSMPIFAGGSHTGRRKEAVAQMAAAQSELDRLTREFQQKIRRSARRAAAYADLAEARHEEMRAQSAEVDAVRRQFEAGVRPYQDYERAEAALAMAEIGDIEARYQVLQERLRLAALLEELP